LAKSIQSKLPCDWGRGFDCNNQRSAVQFVSCHGASERDWVCGAGKGGLVSRHPRAFPALLGTSGAVFAGFIVFAMVHGHQQSVITERLDTLRSEGLLLEQKPQTGMNAFEYADWQKELNQWQDGTANYLKENIGDVAKNRFISTMGRGSLSYVADQQFNGFLNALVWRGKNLQEIIDGRSHPK
jgi:hypothetical protein